MADIFISYARADRAKIEKLARTLTASGYDVWWDRDITGGTEFSAVIERELIASKTVVVAWSENSLGSHWVRDEAEFARTDEKLLPISLDGVLPPLGFRQIHALRFEDWNGDGSHPSFRELLASLAKTPSQGTSSQSEEFSPRAPGGSASIAVLPFTNMSSEPEQEYFSDGIAEDILNALSSSTDLLVAGRTSCFAFKGRNANVQDIGAQLNVDHVLDGSVRKQGDRVRITAQLIRASDGYQMWSERYDGTLEDVFDLQDRISGSIVEQLQAVLTSTPEGRVAEQLTDNPEAYDLFLRARALVNKVWGADTLTRAVTILEQTVELDPEFVSAWELLARAHFLVPQFISDSDEKLNYAASEKAARRALDLDPSSDLAQYLVQAASWDGMDIGQFLERIARPVDRATADELVFVGGLTQLVLGRVSAALPKFRDALNRDPLSGRMAYNLAECHLELSMFERAEELFNQSIENGFSAGFFGLAKIRMMKGKPAEALDVMMSAYEAIGEGIYPHMRSREQWELVGRAAYAGDQEAQAKVEASIIAMDADGSQPVNYLVLTVLICEQSAETFFRLYKKKSSPAMHFCIAHSFWQPSDRAHGFRQHPGFKPFAEEIGLVDAWQKFGWPDLARPNPGTDGSNGAWTID